FINSFKEQLVIAEQVDRGGRMDRGHRLSNLVAAVCYIMFFPETQGKTLEQMDQVFGGRVVQYALQDANGAEGIVAETFRRGSVVSEVENKK
ncbi:MAG: hypothetical protein M1823_008730, partial [Watsoniomyces obsoletus]